MDPLRSALPDDDLDDDPDDDEDDEDFDDEDDASDEDEEEEEEWQVAVPAPDSAVRACLTSAELAPTLAPI